MKQLFYRLWLFMPAVLAFIAACVTVNIYFPAAAVEKTAEEFVGDVYRKNEHPPQERQEPNGQPRSWKEDGFFGSARLAWIGPAPAHAQEATTVSNAAIRALKEEIARRHGELLPYYQGGQVGITSEGYLEARDTGGLNLSQVAALRRLVDADNAARRRLYDEVGRALNLTPEQVPQVRQIFAKQWRDQAQGGWWVQTDDGQWARK
jgi:uncharacterized protein